MMSTNGIDTLAVVRPPAAAATQPKSKSLSDFWRALKLDWPYCKQILISIGCVLFVGLAMSFSLAALTPILRVLLANQTIQQWADTTVAEKRLGVHFLDDVQQVQLAQVKPEDAA